MLGGYDLPGSAPSPSTTARRIVGLDNLEISVRIAHRLPGQEVSQYVRLPERAVGRGVS